MAATSAVITLIGIERSLQYENISVFDDIILPSGIDKDTLVNTIKLEAGSFELLYSDPVFLTASINIWSKGWQDTWTKWSEALSAQYDPIENYNRYEDLKEEHTGKDSRTGSSSGNSRGSGSNNNNTSGSTSSSSEDKVSAFNSSDYQNKDKNTSSGSDSSNAFGTYSNEGSSSSSSTDNGTNEHLTKHTNHIHGNIGVTTSQQMLESEMKLRENYNIYRLITDLFIREFCIMVY